MKKRQLKTKIESLIRESLVSEMPVVAPEPITKPAPAPPKPSTPQPKPNNPLVPKPGIRTRPKALSHDVQAFINARKNLQEAINVGDYPDFIDPEKRADIENEKDYVESILPDLGQSADKYLEIITSEGYKKAVDRLSHYIGIPVASLQGRFPDLPSMVNLLLEIDKQIKVIEKNHRPQLENMAKEVVLNLKEYKFIKQLVQAGNITLDVKLDRPDLTAALTDEDMDQMMGNQLTITENLNAQIYSVLVGGTDGKLRRAFANFLGQGDAINKFFLFNIVEDELKKIDVSLPQKYGLISAVSLVLNYRLPKVHLTRHFVNYTAVGSEQVIAAGDGYTIKVRAANFPLLIHEFVKGVNDYLSMDVADQEELDTEKLSDEFKQFLAGPGLDNRLRTLIPADKIEYLPLIKKLLYRLPIPHIKELLLGGGKAQAIMKHLIKTAEEQLKDFNT